MFDRRKFLPPVLPEIICPRAELIRRCDSSNGRRFILVSSPAGYGKSLSTQIWLSGNRRKTAWLSLDKYDNDRVTFYNFLGWALAGLQPNNAVIETILNENLIHSNPVEAVMRMFSAFIPDKKECALVLDDFQTITNENILSSLPHALKRLPASVTTVILTKDNFDQPFFNQHQFEDAVRLSKDDLTFSVAETADYLALAGVEAAEDEVLRLHELTGGWIMGLSAYLKVIRKTPADPVCEILRIHPGPHAELTQCPKQEFHF
jgi:ATP-dependent transcriptional regulator